MRWATRLSVRSGLLAVGLVFAVGCGATSARSERHCTLIAGRIGVGLEIAAPHAERTAIAHLRACAGDVCREGDLQLNPSTAAVPDPCTGEVCAARVTPTGGKHGFLDMPGLTGAPLRVTLTLRDAAGAELLVREADVTPRESFPNGPDCGSNGFQAPVALAADGTFAGR
ncbi:hypothetical protein [Yinghuangia sp. YIM S09857]|uniref:hypothetical protein n=1 Tax=Yinghuangia sp. YIM S09857 TaxID=3436929 RepID=UPI003F5383C2